MNPFTITERSPMNQSVLDALNDMTRNKVPNTIMKSSLIAFIIKNVPNPTVGLVGRYFDAVSKV